VLGVNPRVSAEFAGIYKRSIKILPELEKSHSALQKILKDTGLSKRDSMEPKLSSSENTYVTRLYTDFANELGLSDPSALLDLSPNPLFALKITMGYFRRLERLFQFEQDGKFRIPELG
jgi:hypothetical protein